MLPEAGSCIEAALSGERGPSRERNAAPNGVGKLRRSTKENDVFSTGLRESLSDANSSDTREFVQSKLLESCNLTGKLDLLRAAFDLKSAVATETHCLITDGFDAAVLVSQRSELSFVLELDATISPACI